MESYIASSDFNEQSTAAMRHKSWLREVFDARKETIAHLSRIGFDELREGELIVLGAVIRAVPPQILVDVMSDLGMSGREIGQAQHGLISRGLLSRKPGDGPGRGKITPTTQGLHVCNAILVVTRIRRWANFPLRQDDIVIATVPKSGTTWIQMICALLTCQTPDLPAPLQKFSLWLEDEGLSHEELLAQLASQDHRRIIKTHLSLSEIPIDPRVTYITIARDPLDMALSLSNVHAMAQKNGGVEVFPPRDSLDDWLNQETPFEVTLPRIIRQLSGSWDRRNEPNVILMHYERLSEDLEGEMRRLAIRLGISVPETTWPALVRAATFDQMRAAADRLQPISELKDPAAFFHSGKSGRGRSLLTDEALARYHEQLGRLAPPDLVSWLRRQPPTGDSREGSR